MNSFEVNIDGLVGPTHNYAGLAFGNQASTNNAGAVSNPRAAALQGLSKMKLLHSLGVRQMVLPPHQRPYVRLLSRAGFGGDVDAQISAAAARAPELLPFAYSASGMWAANAATTAPSSDTANGKVHFTPANLLSSAHRAIESGFAYEALMRLFPSPAHFTHHLPLPGNPLFADEGAANHMRLQKKDGTGVHVFVYGRNGLQSVAPTTRYPARQTLQASQGVARLHGLKEDRVLFVQQRPEAIDAGAFHNDVIATSHENVLLYHEHAFADGEASVDALRRLMGNELCPIRVSAKDMTAQDAVRTYLFNSQIVTTPKGMVLIAPTECEQDERVREVVEAMVASAQNPVNAVQFVDLRESMRNGGGPACLRLRVTLNDAEWKHVNQAAVFTDVLHDRLSAWVKKHYRETLSPDDLRDPQLAKESAAALAELTVIMQLGTLYEQ